MLERPIRYLAILLSAIMELGFILFAVDDVGRASDTRVGELAAYQVADPTPAGEQERERQHGKVREGIDDANDVLLKPFAGLVEGAGSRWVQRGVPALLGLLVFGGLLAYLGRYTHGHG